MVSNLKRPSSPDQLEEVAIEDEIITFPPAKKPRIGRFESNEEDGSSSNLLSRLSTFLPALKAADRVLETERAEGRLALRRMEISDSDDTDSDPSSEEASDDEEEQSLVDDDSDDESAVSCSSSTRLSTDGNRTAKFDADDDVSDVCSSLSPSSSSDDEEDEDEDEGEEDEEPDVMITGNKTHEANALSQTIISQLLQQPGLSNSSMPTDTTSQKKRKKEGPRSKEPYIVMNLGLGVLEEIRQSGREVDENADLMEKVLAARRNMNEEDTQLSQRSSHEKEEYITSNEVQTSSTINMSKAMESPDEQLISAKTTSTKRKIIMEEL